MLCQRFLQDHDIPWGKNAAGWCGFSSDEIRFSGQTFWKRLICTGEVHHIVEACGIADSASDFKCSCLWNHRVYTNLGNCFGEDFCKTILLKLGSDVVYVTFSKCIFCGSWHSGIEILTVGSECFGTFQMHQIAEQSAGIARSIGKLCGVMLLRCKGIDLFNPDSSHITERARITAEMYVIGLSDNAAHKSGNQCAAVFYEVFQSFFHTVFYHIKDRRSDHVVF